jgi:PAS domain S-box-containing protein
MRHVPYSWYKLLHWTLTGVSVLAAAGYLAGRYFAPELAAILGLTLLSTIIAGFHAGYAVVVYPFLQRKAEWGASLMNLLIFTLLVISLVHTTGGFGSHYYALWLLLLSIAGLFGLYVLIGYCFLVTIYFVLIVSGGFGVSNSLDLALVALGASYVVAVFAYYLWRRSFVDESEEHAVALGKELQAEQLKSEILINAITDGVVVFDTTAHIQYMNPAGARMLGWKVSDAVGLDYHSLFRFFNTEGKDEVELNDTEHPYQRVFVTGKPVNLSAVTLMTKAPDKRLIVSLSVSPILTGPNEISGAIAVFRDVSAEKRQERQRSEFISTASHEMRTPIAAIEGYLSLALNDKVCKVDTKARGFLGKAHESTQHLGTLFRDLLAASKSEEGRIENHPRVIELGSFIDGLVNEMRFSAEKKGLKVDFLVAAQPAAGASTVIRPLFYVHADPDRMREVLSNLINNAIKYTQEGGVTVGLRGEPTYVQISVKDTGFGIPAEDIPHLFQKFYRVDNSATRTIGGTGLGLFISRNIIELYKGQIWVESEMSKGSTFFVNLPRLSTEQAETMTQKEKQEFSPLAEVSDEPALT